MPDDKRGSQLLLGAGAVVLLGVVVVLAWIMLNDDPASRMPEPAPLQLGPDTVDNAPAAADVQTASYGSLRGRQSQAGLADSGPAGVTAVAFDDDSLTFTAILPNAGATDAALTFLRHDAETYLKRMKPAARAEIDAARAAGQPAHPWEVHVEWNYTARAGSIVSLAGRASEFTGGAHPAEFYDAHIASLTDGVEMEIADMLVPDRWPNASISVAICEALKAAKRDRIGEETIMGAPVVCAGPQANTNIESAAIALAPSTLPDRFGGLFVYYGPYAVGPRSEGPYRLTIQQAVFHEDLRDEYKPLFAGEAPVPAH